VITTGGRFGGMPNDPRVGSSDLMSAAATAGTAVKSVSGMYDLAGKASALRALAN
jgi:hypothetical protein